MSLLCLCVLHCRYSSLSLSLFFSPAVCLMSLTHPLSLCSSLSLFLCVCLHLFLYLPFCVSSSPFLSVSVPPSIFLALSLSRLLSLSFTCCEHAQIRCTRPLRRFQTPWRQTCCQWSHSLTLRLRAPHLKWRSLCRIKPLCAPPLIISSTTSTCTRCPSSMTVRKLLPRWDFCSGSWRQNGGAANTNIDNSLACSAYIIQPLAMPHNLMQSHRHRMHAFVAVTATCMFGGMTGTFYVLLW